MTIAPELKNRDEVARSLERNYPPLLRDAGISGEVVVWLLLTTDGQVAKTQVHVSSGHGALDEAALRVAADMNFSPAWNKDSRVAVWVSLPIKFAARSSPTAAMAQRLSDERRQTLAESARRLRADVQESPVAAAQPQSQNVRPIPLETLGVEPTLTNREEVARALERNYPPLLRDAGIGGETLVALLLSETGHVLKLQVMKTSGEQALDEAATRVAATMRFTPAAGATSERREALWGWVTLPIKFTTK
jgi:TonB family protein